jgi:hypothetical protein
VCARVHQCTSMFVLYLWPERERERERAYMYVCIRVAALSYCWPVCVCEKKKLIIKQNRLWFRQSPLYITNDNIDNFPVEY